MISEPDDKAQEKSFEQTSQQQFSEMDVDNDPLFRDLVTWHDNILKYLLKYRVEHSDFTFRLNDNHRDLEQGLWFPGNGNIVIDLFSFLSDNDTLAVLLIVEFQNSSPDLHLQIHPYKNEKESKIYHEFISRLKLERRENHGYKFYEGEPVTALSDFLNGDYQMIRTVAGEVLTQDQILFPQGTFERLLSDVLEIRSKLYPSDPIDPEAIPSTNSTEENVNLQKDAAALEDLLGRKPFVDALANYIFRMWETEHDNEPYTVHLSGEWGSGKTSILNFLEGNLKRKGWYVVKFNAWQNQYMDPPWWILLDNVYRQIYNQKAWPKRWLFWLKEMKRRIFTINASAWWTFIIFLTLTLLILKADFVSNWFYGLFPGFETTDSLKTISSLFALAGTIWAFIRGVNNSLLPGSSQAAQNFQKNAQDPMRQVKRHFDSLVRSADQKLAIFLDDADRCEPKFLVQLLEGIQTLFKNSRTLYVVSGDGAWLRHCFEIHYDKFSGIVKKPGHSLGNSFLEKIFQMSISVPVMSETSKLNYWNYLLGKKGAASSDQKMEDQARMEMALARDEKEVDQLAQKYKNQPMEPYMRKAAVEKLSEKAIQENIEHRLTKFASQVNANPRSMKRLINRYSLIRQSMILKGVSFNEVSLDDLAHWIIFQSKYPVYGDRLKEDPGLINAGIQDEPQLISAINEIKPHLSDIKIQMITSG